MSDQNHSNESHDDGDHDVHNHYGLFIQVAIALVILTAASYCTTSAFWPFGESVAIKRLWMMGVSCCKASLVIAIFMHLWWETNWKWVLTIPASLMCVFLTLMLVPDIGLRIWNGYSGYSRERLIYSAEMPEDEAPEQSHEEHDDHHAHDNDH